MSYFKPVYDDSVTSWDYNGAGYYWSRHTGIDADGDGIGDTPHEIHPDNTDHHPLMSPHVPPEE